MKKLLQIFILIFCFPCLPFAGWLTFTVDDSGDVGGYTSLDLDSANHAHIVYKDYENLDLKYARWDGSNWNIEVIDNDIEWNGGQNGLVLDGAEQPHVAYCVGDAGYYYLKYAYFDGSSWHKETVNTSYGIGRYPSLVLDSSGNPHIACQNEINNDLIYATKNGSNWQMETVDNGYVYGHTSIALDSSDNPHIAYNCSGLMYAYNNGSQWQTEMVDSKGIWTSIQVDSSQNPCISYDYGNPEYDLRFARKTGPNWDIQTVDEEGSVGSYTSLDLDSQGRPHISYTEDNESLKYAFWDGSSWQTDIVESDYYIGGYTSLRIDTDENPRISYFKWGSIYGDRYLCYAYPDYVGENDDTPANPSGYVLFPAYPNPSSDSVTIAFALPEECAVNIEVFDIKGRKVMTLVDRVYAAGKYEITANGFEKGLYLYRIIAAEYTDIKKMIVE